MTFISDVIYGLKTDENYSQHMLLNKDVFTFDTKTGINTLDSENSISLSIEFVILLPLNVRQAFFRAIHLQKDGALKPGESQVVIDTADLNGIKVEKGFYLIDDSGLRYDVTAVEYVRDEAVLITTQTPT